MLRHAARMVIRHVRKSMPLWFVLCSLSVAEESEEMSTSQRIARIETEIAPALVIEGEEPVAHNVLERMDYHGVPGMSIAVIKDGRVDWARGYGLGDVETQQFVDQATLFQAGSISKPIAALGALVLVENGALSLDADMNESMSSWQIPNSEFTEEASVTLRGILSHTAGLSIHGFPGYSPGEAVPSTVGVLNGQGNTDSVLVVLIPRTERRYSGGGYTVMQLAVEDAAEEGFAEFMAGSVLAPLGMTESTYDQPLPADRREQAATGYLSSGEPVKGQFHTYPEMAAAGLWTTPTDLARYLISVQRGKTGESKTVISRELVEEMLTPEIGDNGLGPGLTDDRDRFGHGGSTVGYRCTMTAFVDGRGGVVVMTNSANGGTLTSEMVLTVAREYGWPGLEPTHKSIVSIPASELERFAGTYEHDRYKVEIDLADGELLAKPGWGSTKTMQLVPESSSRFFLRKDGNEVEFIAGDEDVKAMRLFGIEFTRVSD